MILNPAPPPLPQPPQDLKWVFCLVCAMLVVFVKMLSSIPADSNTPLGAVLELEEETGAKIESFFEDTFTFGVNVYCAESHDSPDQHISISTNTSYHETYFITIRKPSRLNRGKLSVEIRNVALVEVREEGADTVVTCKKFGKSLKVKKLASCKCDSDCAEAKAKIARLHQEVVSCLKV